ncbi:MAG: tRNA (adenosine(37)-N6)-threonylcarbamoyltransferase complex ATPase subunit type 1 TsaE [Pyrinomonadaceae bacterium]
MDTMICEAPQDTFEVGESLGVALRGGEVILLYGGLGAGKTLFTKGVLSAIGFDVDEVTSPSFSLVNLYKASSFDVYHIDLWRLDAASNPAETVGLGEILENENAVTIIEWADRLGDVSFRDEPTIITIDGDGDEPRRISIARQIQERILKDARIVVRKSARTLELFDGDSLVNTYRIGLGSSPIPDKQIEGDGKTPEGVFYIAAKNPESKYHLSLCISYPDAAAAARGRTAGLIDQAEYDEICEAIANKRLPPQKTKLGGAIYIHGGGTETDWTEGCVALTNEEMSEIFEAACVGTPVIIYP